jgi:hypothetical protein
MRPRSHDLDALAASAQYISNGSEGIDQLVVIRLVHDGIQGLRRLGFQRL